MVHVQDTGHALRAVVRPLGLVDITDETVVSLDAFRVAESKTEVERDRARIREHCH